MFQRDILIRYGYIISSGLEKKKKKEKQIMFDIRKKLKIDVSDTYFNSFLVNY